MPGAVLGPSAAAHWLQAPAARAPAQRQLRDQAMKCSALADPTQAGFMRACFSSSMASSMAADRASSAPASALASAPASAPLASPAWRAEPARRERAPSELGYPSL
jgi:hypothetical protein